MYGIIPRLGDDDALGNDPTPPAWPADLYRKFGLMVGGWRTLSIIGRYEPIHPGSIAERTSVEPDKVTRAVDRLVGRGLVARKADSKDRRRIVLTLTVHGRRIHAEIDGVRRAGRAIPFSTRACAEAKAIAPGGR